VTEDGGEEGRKHAGEVANSFWGSEREEACWSSPYTAAQSGGGDSTTVGWMKGGGAGEVVSEPPRRRDRAQRRGGGIGWGPEAAVDGEALGSGRRGGEPMMGGQRRG
jgi:hypothetical protein